MKGDSELGNFLMVSHTLTLALEQRENGFSQKSVGLKGRDKMASRSFRVALNFPESP